MLGKIYNQHADRTVREAPGHEHDLLASIRRLSRACKEGVFLLEEELESNDPDLSERCGLLADRHEVYAIRIPGCRGYRLAVSIDLKSTKPPPVTIHGAIQSQEACAVAGRLATAQLGLINPTWEMQT